MNPDKVGDGRQFTAHRCAVDGCRGFYKWAFMQAAWRLTPCGRCGHKPAPEADQ